MYLYLHLSDLSPVFECWWVSMKYKHHSTHRKKPKTYTFGYSLLSRQINATFLKYIYIVYIVLYNTWYFAWICFCFCFCFCFFFGGGSWSSSNNLYVNGINQWRTFLFTFLRDISVYIVELSFLFYSSILLDESKTGLLVLSHILPPSAAGSMQDDVVRPSRIRFLRFVRARVAMSNQPKYLSIALTSLSLSLYIHW